jgi:hypothetical protein
MASIPAKHKKAPITFQGQSGMSKKSEKPPVNAVFMLHERRKIS